VTDQQNILIEMVDRLFRDAMASGMPKQRAMDSQDSFWRSLDELGLCDIFSPEVDGGFGGGWQDAFIVFNLLGYYALPLPVGETIVSRKLLLEAEIDRPAGASTIGICQNALLKTGKTSDKYLFTGKVDAVPWGAYASHVVLACGQGDDQYLALLPTASAKTVTDFSNEAGEPRCDISFDNAEVIQHRNWPSAVDKVMFYGALLRSAQTSGALESALDSSISHVNDRIQFGRPLSKFQVIQHQLAVLAEEAAAVSCAARSACSSADNGDPSFEIAAAKIRANRAVSRATSIAHQVHGAIGITREHPLHFSTQRMWSWRAEFGNDRYWANYLGRTVLKEGAENFWKNFTARSDRGHASNS